MVKSATRRTSGETATASRSAFHESEPMPAAQGDVARRAYRLYLTRGAEHGHDLDDWLQAERELRSEVSTTVHD